MKIEECQNGKFSQVWRAMLKYEGMFVSTSSTVRLSALKSRASKTVVHMSVSREMGSICVKLLVFWLFFSYFS